MTSAFRPLVAVVAYHLGGDRVARWPDGGYGVPAPYLEALRRAGARTAIISPGEPGAPEELLEPFHGLLLVGGGDVDPARYGAAPDTAHNYGVEPDRDTFEIDLVRAADRMHLPTLCICRGMQILNVAFGGTLHQHLPDRPGLMEHGVPVDDTTTTHPVTPVPGTSLSAATKSGDLTCSSHHHQGVDQVGEGFVVRGTEPRRPRRGTAATHPGGTPQRQRGGRDLAARRPMAPGGVGRFGPHAAVPVRRALDPRPDPGVTGATG